MIEESKMSRADLAAELARREHDLEIGLARAQLAGIRDPWDRVSAVNFMRQQACKREVIT